MLIPVCLSAAGLFYLPHSNSQPPSVVRIATGAESGTYHPLGQGIADVLDARISDLVQAEVLATAGSPDNLERLERGEVERARGRSPTAPRRAAIG